MPNETPSSASLVSSGEVSKPSSNQPNWRKWALITAACIVGFWILILGVGYFYINASLPKLNKLTDYRPLRVTEIYAQDLRKFGEFSTEERFVVPYEHFPETLIHAVIASEDASFFEHRGIDYGGIIRAFLKNVIAGRIVQGGSTITQQVAKSFLLTSERSYRRKIMEAILALRIEKNLSKQDILYLYLNQIYLGHGSYGVQAAAQNYFHKDVRDITVAECALLAGMPQAPSRYSPFTSAKAAKERQSYVLERMLAEKFITEEQMKQAEAEEIKLFNRKELHVEMDAPDYAEHVRRYIQEKYGSKALYEEGLKVYTALDLNKQKSAQDAVRKGLRELDRRQGYRGPLGHLDVSDQAAVDKFTMEVHEEVNRLPFFILASLEDLKKGVVQKNLFPDKTPLKEGILYRGLVREFEASGNYMEVGVGTEKGRVLLEDMKWARVPNPSALFDPEQYYVKDARKKFKVGDIVLLSYRPLVEGDKKNKKYQADITYFKLEQEPLVQGALLSLDPLNGFVVAMVGGYSFQESEFNRAVQSLRQPGSAFKPIIYAAALDKGYTASSIIVDSPIVYETQSEKDDELLRWRPKNYGSKFHGDTPLRTGLIKSMNVITIKILKDIGINYTINYARKMGITSPLAPDLSLALGSSDVSLLELTNAYAVFDQGGKKRDPVFITKITNADGEILERHTEEDVDLSQQEAFDWLKRRVADLFFEEILFKLRPAGAAPGPSPETTAVTINSEDPTAPEESPQNVAAADENAVAAPSSPPAHTGSLPDYMRKAGLNREEWEIIYEKPPPGYVITPQTAYLMSNLLSQVVQYGTAQRVKILPRPAAGKTGTTNDEYDAWFIGFTPDVVTGVWVGYDQKKPLGSGEVGGKAAAPIWLYYMERAIDDTPFRNFDVPPGIVFTAIDKRTGLLAEAKTPPDQRVVSAYLEGTQPTTSEPSKSNLPDVDEMFFPDYVEPPDEEETAHQ